MPPICDVCGTDFRANPQSGSLVRFRRRDAAGASAESRVEPGHPPNAAWYCVLHQGPALTLSELDIEVAQPLIRRISLWRSLVLLVGTSVLSGAIALGGMLVGGAVGNTPGLFVGSLAGGTTGVLSSGLIAAAAEYLPRPVVPSSIVGGILGFLMAAVLTIGGSTSFGSAIVPFVSTFFVGAGFLLGRRYAARRLSADPVETTG